MSVTVICVADPSEVSQDSISVSHNFKSNFSRANKFWELYEDGLKLYESGNYNGAIELYKKALKDYSASKPTRAAAMRQIALSNEAIHNFEEAIKYYELASETTMSQRQRAILLESQSYS